MKTKLTGRSAFLVLLGLTGLLFFEVTGARADEGDPPARVARISYVQGSVSFQPGGAGDWASAEVNRTVTVGDRLWSDSGARAELQAGAAAIHLSGSTALSFLNLDDRTTQMRLAEGAINFRVRELHDGDLYEVDTPNLAFTVRRAGEFRIDVNEAGDFTGVTAFRGEGEVTAGGQSYKVRESERAEFRGAENPQYDVSRASGPDTFDRWATERDTRGDHSASARYVSRDVIGYEDLDDYGDWRDEPDYGPVWYPRHVSVGWAPYRDGYWSWVGPWGWTWVDYAPWGFAPFHYGRWAYAGGGWGWCPGPIYASPVWAPALVGWYGGGGWGGGFGFGGGWGGGIGWFPLGFGEPFFPWFHSSQNFITVINVNNTHIRNVNVLHTTNIRNVNFVHARNVNAVTVVPRNAFANGQAVNRAALRVTPESLRNAQVTNRADVTPTQRSMLGAKSNGRVSTPPAAIQNRAVLTRATPAAGASHLPVRPANPDTHINARGATASPSSPLLRGGQGDARSRMPENERVSQRPADRPNVMPQQKPVNPARPPENIRPIPDRNPSGRESARPPSAPPAVRNERMGQADRPPWARNGGSGTPDVRPHGNADRGVRETSRPSVPSAPRQSDRPNSRMPDQRMPDQRRNDRSATPNRSADRPSRSYEPPRSYSRGAPSYDRGSRAPESPRYSAPSRSYSAPPRSYSAPRSYSPPQRSYSAPSRSYSAPSRSYSAPSRSYSAPSRSYSAPSRGSSSGGSSRGNGSSRPRR